MIRIILGLVLTIELVSTAFAFKIHNGRLIEHREWTTGNAVLRVKDTLDDHQVKSAKLIFKEMKKDLFTASKDGILLRNKVFNSDETGVVGTETIIDGYINAYIENLYSDTAKTYTIYSNFCLSENCAKSSYKIHLDPGGFFELGVKRAVSFNFEKPGPYKAILTSLVESDDLTSDFATMDEGYIDILK